MSIANHKGGFSHTLRVTQNNKNESLCMLDKPFLKKAQNWSLQVTDFFINKVQALNLELDEQLRIIPYRAAGFGAGWKESDYVFTPKNCYTVLEYTIQLQEFFRKFSYLFMQFGVAVDVVNGVNTSVAVFATDDEKNGMITENFNATPVHYVRRNNVPSLDGNGNVVPIYDAAGQNVIGVEEADEGYLGLRQICTCFVDNQLKLSIRLEPTFLANFFIQCSEPFRRRLGFMEFLYRLVDIPNGGFISPGMDPPKPLFDEASNIQANGFLQFHQDVLNSINPANIQALDGFGEFPSDFTIRELDDRLSLDVICTFPASRKIFVLDGNEDHEYLLARFDLSSYKEFEGVSTQNDEKMLESTKVTESFQAGMHNLTLHNPDYESNLLLPGSIHQVHLMLYTRYLQDNKIVSVKTDLTDGFWHIRMLFSKKI